MVPPIKKKYNDPQFSFASKPPLPILITSEEYDNQDLWFNHTGRYNGINVVVDDPSDIISLYTMGFFGKGCLSNKSPYCILRSDVPKIIKERQWKRRKEWMEIISSQEDQREPSNVLNTIVEDEGKSNVTKNLGGLISKNDNSYGDFIVIDDSGDENEDYLNNLNPKIENDSSEIVFESLHLLCEEAFFLSFGIGCLEVIDLFGNLLDVTSLWNLFRKSNIAFPEQYVAYHHFRSKGWVVKSGIKFGGRYVLYKKGPPFYHSSYIVVLDTYDAKGVRTADSQLLSLTTLNRLAESTHKEVLVCQVQYPELTEEELFNPDVIRKFKVKENIFQRWLAEQNRESV